MEKAAETESHDGARGNTDERYSQSLAQYHANDAAGRSAKSYPYPDFNCPLSGAVGDDAVNAGHSKKQAKKGKQGRSQAVER